MAAAIVIASAIVPLTQNAQAAIPVPHNRFGRAFDAAAQPLLDGESITAWIDGVSYGQNFTWTDGNQGPGNQTGQFDIDVRGNYYTNLTSPNTPWIKEGGDIADPIMYASGDMTGLSFAPNEGVFVETGSWQTAAVVWGDLNLAPAGDQPSLLPKINNITVSPSDGPPAYVRLYSTPSTDLSAFYLEKNDGVMNGATQALTGLTTDPSGLACVELTTVSLGTNGDELKLVWTNAGTAFGGNDIVVDRVEMNGTGNDQEPDNTNLTDAAVPGSGQEIRRSSVGLDTNDGSDFVVATETGRCGVNQAPSVTIDYPNGAQSWSGGSAHNIWWNMSDDADADAALTVWVNYTSSAGSGTIAGPLTGLTDPSSTSWATPLIDAVDVTINVTAADTLDAAGSAEQLVNEIDSTFPQVASTDPTNGHPTVETTRPLQINFTEPMDEASVEAGLTYSPAIPGISYTWLVPGEQLQINHGVLTEGLTYCVYLEASAMDDSDPGNGLDGNANSVYDGIPADNYSFCFTTFLGDFPPIVTITLPIGGEVWTGGSMHSVAWTLSDEDVPSVNVWLNSSSVGDPDCDSTKSLPQGTMSDLWTAPTLCDANDVTLTVDAVDFLGQTGSDSVIITVDSTPPTVSTTSPIDGDQNVPPATAQLQVTWSEAMSPSFGSVAIAPNVLQGFNLVPPSTLLIDVVSLTQCVQYVVTLSNFRDTSDPGNEQSPNPDSFSFRVQCPTNAPTVDLTVPNGGETWLAGTTENIVWSMSDVEDSSLTLWINYSLVSGTDGYLNQVAGAQGVLMAIGTGLQQPWSIPAGIDTCSVRMKIEVVDSDGLTAVDFSLGDFCINPPSGVLPTITLTAPAGGEVWSCGTPHDIVWTTTKDPATGQGELMVWLNYSAFGGFPWSPIAGAQAMQTLASDTFPWTVANDDTTTAAIMAEILDPNTGKTSDVSPQFTIDCTPPDVTGNAPADGTLDVPFDATISIHFSEPVDTASAEAAVSIVPTIPGLAWQWSGNTDMFGNHSGMAFNTAYQVTVGTGVTDLSDPGLPMAAAYVFGFTTEVGNTPPTVNIITPALPLTWTGGSDMQISWNMNDNEDTDSNLLTVYVNYTSVTLGTGAIAGPTLGMTMTTWTIPTDMQASDIIIEVTVVDTGGLSTTDQSDPQTIQLPTDTTNPVVDARGPYDGDVGQPINFNGSATDPPNAPGDLTYVWVISKSGVEVTTLAGQNPTWTPTSAGDYTVTLKVTDPAGNEGLDSTLITVAGEEPQPDFLSEYWWLLLVLIAVILAIILFLVFGRKRRKEEPEEVVVTPAKPAAPPAERKVRKPAPPPEEEEVVEEEAAEEAPTTKECPSCGTIVGADDADCFMCGTSL